MIGGLFGNLGHGLTPFDFMLVFPQDAHERLLERHLEPSGEGRIHRTDDVMAGGKP